MNNLPIIGLVITALMFSCNPDSRSIENNIVGKWNSFDYSDADDIRKGEPPYEVSGFNNQGYLIQSGGDLYLVYEEYNSFDSTYQQTTDRDYKYSWYLSDDESKLFIDLNNNSADEYEITTLTKDILGIKCIDCYGSSTGRTYYFRK